MFSRIKNKRNAQVITNAGEIIGHVNNLIELKLLAIEGNKVKLYKVLWEKNSRVTTENWIKNLYLYCCLMKNHKEGNPLYFVDIESGEPMGRYEDKKVFVH